MYIAEAGFNNAWKIFAQNLLRFYAKKRKNSQH